ncbi:universal stress protein [Pseudorhodobacter sp.]|uniref:universal stress protein n=1 Tax=Pseudorhodobacter sp. TaxID=1934400 RepID=UPI0026493452|nr:universal stress protein [Pseudorhodobacter sp.]MDN5789159.1 universal stress protein [Pseudorhodobacter sp.]
MYNSILLTVDLSDPASWQRAMPEAVKTCQTTGAKLHVLAVIPTFGMPLVEGFFPDDFQKNAMAKTKTELAALLKAEVPSSVTTEAHTRYGKVHEEILTAIKTMGIDLVVMASPPPDRLRDFLVGSNADRVVRRSTVSILVVR